MVGPEAKNVEVGNVTLFLAGRESVITFEGIACEGGGMRERKESKTVLEV